MSSKMRTWAAAAAVWTCLFLALYLKIAHSDGNGIAWWYVVLVATSVVLNLAATVDGATQRADRALLVSLILLVLAGLLAVASIGLLLVPALVATAIAIGAISRRPAVT